MTKCNNKKSGVDNVQVTELEKAIDVLAKNPNVQINSLSKTDPLYKSFETVKISVSLLYDTNHYSIIHDILSTYKAPSELTPGTFGAFLFGCRQENYGDVKDKYCSVLCINSIPPLKCKGPVTCCNSQVWTHDNVSLKKVSDCKNGTTKAIVYTEFPFMGFTQKEIDELKAAGIKKVTLMQTVNNKHVTIFDSLDIDKVPTKNAVGPSGMGNVVGTGRARDVLISGSSVFWIVILVLGILALLAWLWIASGR